eukprot:COSAG01_NODE_7339_length_3243_cov_8.710878_2_plen_780_part_00
MFVGRFKEQQRIERWAHFATGERIDDEAGRHLPVGQTRLPGSAPLWPTYAHCACSMLVKYTLALFSKHLTSAAAHRARFCGTNTIVAAPSSDMCDSYFEHAYGLIEKYILWDMIRRSPGKFVKSDGTFHIASITLSDAKIVNFFLGEDEACIGWYATKSEAWDELEPALDALVYRLGTQMPRSVLEQVRYWYSDTCCHYCKDADPNELQRKLADHILVRKFPSISRCPYRDSFHATQLITGSCQRGIPSALYLEFCRDAGRVFATPYEPDVQHLANLLYHKAVVNKETSSMAECMSKAKDDSHYSQSIRVVQNEPRKMANDLADLFTTYKKISDETPETEFCWEVKSTKYRRGTRAIFAQEMGCVKNGCMQAPPDLNVPEDTHRLLETKPEMPMRPIYKSKIGTSGNERLHLMVKNHVKAISRISARKIQARLQVKLTIRNHDIDVVNKRIDNLGGFSFKACLLNALCDGNLVEPLYPVIALGTNAKAAQAPLDESQPYMAPMLPLGDVSREKFGWAYYDHLQTMAREDLVASSQALAVIPDATLCQPCNTASNVAGPLTTHRIPQAHNQGLARSAPVELKHADEIELAIQCIASVQNSLNGAAMGANEFHRLCAKAYFEAVLKNERLPLSQRKHLSGYAAAEAFAKLNVSAARSITKRKVKASRQADSGPVKRARKPQKSRVAAKAAIHHGKTITHVGAGRIRFVNGDADVTNSDIACVEMLRAYVSNMKATTMIQVGPGKKNGKDADIKHMTQQLEIYFDAAKANTFTPTCQCEQCS